MHIDCQVMFDEPGSGAWNMALDEAMLELAARHSPRPRAWLRFYTWSPATLTLGYFQEAAECATHPASRACPMVRRPSGGGAIVHDYDLTYALAVSADFPLRSPEALYTLTHETLIDALRTWRVEARLHEPPPPPQSKGKPPFLCFLRHATGDVLVGQHKVAGSAQRKRARAVLQHGSVLLRRSDFAPELPGIMDLMDCTFTPDVLARVWLKELSAKLAWQVSDAPPPAELRQLARRFEADRFGHLAWNLRR